MSQRGVERIVGKLVTDQGFCEDFFRDPLGASLGIGADLTREETDALLRIPRADLAYLYTRLDDRICKLHITRETVAPERRP
jgi:hypothetical protein